MRKAFAILTALATLAAALTGCATSPPAPLQVTHLAFTKWRHDGAGNNQRVTVTWRRTGAGAVDVVTVAPGRAGRRYAAGNATSIEVPIPAEGPLTVALTAAGSQRVLLAGKVESPLVWRRVPNPSIAGFCGPHPMTAEGRRLLLRAYDRARVAALLGTVLVVASPFAPLAGRNFNVSNLLDATISSALDAVSPIEEARVVSSLYVAGFNAVAYPEALLICRP